MEEAAGARLLAEVGDRVDEVAQTMAVSERFSGQTPPTDRQRRRLARFVRSLFARLDDELLLRAAALRRVAPAQRSLTIRRLVRWSLTPAPQPRGWRRVGTAWAATAPSVVALDLEATGLDSRYQSLIEIAALRYDREGRELSRMACLIDPQRPLSTFIRHATGLDEEALAREGVSLDEALRTLQQFLQPDDVVIGHNVAFDLDFLERLWPRQGHPAPRLWGLCTDLEGRRLLPDAPSHGLSALCAQLGIAREPAHRALSDAMAAHGLYRALLRFEGLGER